MSDPTNTHLSFSAVTTPTARLIRSLDLPPLENLTSGDMVICEPQWADLSPHHAAGVHVRTGNYRHEEERVITRRTLRFLSPDYPQILGLAHAAPPGEYAAGPAVEASTEAFAQTWDALSTELDTNPSYVPAQDFIPDSWLPYLPFPTLNPAQAQAAPYVTGDRSLLVVAPTGAGKTVVGMMAVLREILGNGRKAAWLVPQRSLTAELDRELETWRGKGLKVVALSGESATDREATKNADLWVATTEKFEALCRASSMRETIAQIGTLVVDEIHLLGDATRGALLEGLLARIRGEYSQVRLVGLSATAANADEVAQWLDADLVEITWRPTRQTRQLLTIPTGDRIQEGRHRSALAAALVKEVSTDNGSTLVFCGAKASVRATALAIAATRGASTTGVDLNDIDTVGDVCDSVGVGLHYSDWPRKKQAEHQFRARETDVLVATSTLAAGVNTPARVVIVRDTTIGPQPIEVSTVLQMFGRAGRAGQEAEGWAFLITSAEEIGRWRQRITDGYTICSGITQHLPDHMLAEIVQGRITTLPGIEHWWNSTFAHHQGHDDIALLNRARELLLTWGFIEITPTSKNNTDIRATRLGALTSKMMVPVLDAASLMRALSTAPCPRTAAGAEEVLIQIIARNVQSLATSPDAPKDQAGNVLRLQGVGGDVRALDGSPHRFGEHAKATGETVVQTALLLLARSPQALNGRARQITGINRALLVNAYYESPRYFAWIAAASAIGSLPPWAAAVAIDLGPRAKHHHLCAPRGAGRILRAIEHHVGPNQPRRVGTLWAQANTAGARTPADIPHTPKDLVKIAHAQGTFKAHNATTVFTLPAANGQPTRWTREDKPTFTNPTGDTIAISNTGDVAATGWARAFTEIGGNR